MSSISYAATNALSSQTYGNNLIQALSYNSRQQTSEIKLGTSGNSTSVLDLTYSYGTTSNNGNLQSVTYAGGGLSYTQSFTYDSLNRLTVANETNGGTTNWSQTNVYDRYANRQIDYGGGNYNLTFSSSTNRITTSGYSYDSAGNLTNDTIHSYGFDAENKIKTVDSTTAYVYDGEGQRVRKLVVENTRFVYGIGGQLVAEFDGSSGNLKKEYVNGPTLITIEPTAVNSNGTRYSTSDHLGSPRVVSDSSASVVSRHDFMPFGEALAASVGGRTTGMGFSVTDGLRQKFTSKERDSETGLDYFLARYYSQTQGRFTGFDAGPFTPADPQNFNRYSYAQNNPLKFVDPSGRKIELTGDAQAFIDYLESKAGLTLKYKTKNGVTTITGSKTNKAFKGEINKEFAKTVREVAGANGTAKFNVSRGQSNEKGEVVFFDDNKAAFDSNPFDNANMRAANVNLESIQSVDSQDSGLSMALVGHFLVEGLEMRQPGANYDLGTSGAHQIGLEVERKIL